MTPARASDYWLPHIQVLKGAAWLCETDPRALTVRERDAEDFPATALGALLSPCLMFTHNYKHFGVLGAHNEMQCRAAACQAERQPTSRQLQ